MRWLKWQFLDELPSQDIRKWMLGTMYFFSPTKLTFRQLCAFLPRGISFSPSGVSVLPTFLPCSRSSLQTVCIGSVHIQVIPTYLHVPPTSTHPPRPTHPPAKTRLAHPTSPRPNPPLSHPPAPVVPAWHPVMVPQPPAPPGSSALPFLRWDGHIETCQSKKSINLNKNGTFSPDGVSFSPSGNSFSPSGVSF